MAWALMPGFLLVPCILIPFAPLTRKRVAASTSKRAVRSGEYAYCVRISDDGPRPGAYAYGPGRTLCIRAGKRTDLAHSLARTCTFSLRLIPACGLDRRGSCPWPNQGQLLVVSSVNWRWIGQHKPEKGCFGSGYWSFYVPGRGFVSLSQKRDKKFVSSL